MTDNLTTIRNYLTAHTIYDADTIEIDGDGVVSALRDADKTYNAPETERVTLGHVDEMLAEAALAATTTRHADDVIRDNPDCLGLAIVSDSAPERRRRWLCADNKWSGAGPQTATSWPEDVMIFDSFAAAKSYADANRPIDPNAYGLYGFDFIHRR